LLLPCSPLPFWRAVRRSIAVPEPEAGPLSDMEESIDGVSWSIGGNWSPPSGGEEGSTGALLPPPPFIGLATPKLGRPPPTPPRFPNALMPCLRLAADYRQGE
jgi:hypothetical protein